MHQHSCFDWLSYVSLAFSITTVVSSKSHVLYVASSQGCHNVTCVVGQQYVDLIMIQCAMGNPMLALRSPALIIKVCADRRQVIPVAGREILC